LYSIQNVLDQYKILRDLGGVVEKFSREY
jgi:hypothetical protein